MQKLEKEAAKENALRLEREQEEKELLYNRANRRGTMKGKTKPILSLEPMTSD